MTYDLRYKLEFDDIHISTPAKWKVNISVRKDSEYPERPGVFPLTGSAVPLKIIRGDQSDDKFETILGSQVNINIVITDEIPDDAKPWFTTPLQPEQFFAVDETKLKVDIYKNGNIYWSGFVKPDFCNYSYTSTPYEFTIIATDRISLLKSQLLNIQDEINSGGYVSLPSLLLDKGLYQTGLCSTLKLWSSLIHPTPDGMTYPEGEQLSFLDQLRLRYELLMEDTGYPINIYDCIKMIAASFGGRIFYSNNSYHFQRINDLFTESPLCAVYTGKEYPDSRTAVPIRKIIKGEISSSDGIYANNNAFIEIQAASKQEKIDLDYLFRGYLSNFQWAVFEQDGNGNGKYPGWEIHNGYKLPNNPVEYSPYVQRHGDGSVQSPYTLFFKGNLSDTTWISQYVEFSGTSVIWVLKFKVKFFGYKNMAYEVFLDNTDPDPVTYQKLGYANGDWVGSIWPPGYSGWHQFIQRPDDLRKNEVTVEVELPPTHTILLSGNVPSQNPNLIQVVLVDPDTVVNDGTPASERGVEISAITLEQKIYGYTGEVDTMRNTKNYSVQNQRDDIKIIDGFDAVANSIHYGTYGVNNGGTIGSWTDDYLFSSEAQFMTLRGIAEQNRNPYKKLTTTLYSNILEFENVLQQAFGEFPLFIQMYDEYDVKACLHDVSLLQINDSSTPTAEFQQKYKF